MEEQKIGFSPKDGPASSSYAFAYTAKGGSEVKIPISIDPARELGVSRNSGNQAWKQAFRKAIATSDRQRRAIVCYAAHMLHSNTNYNKSRNVDVYDCAICGHTEGL